MSAPRKRAPSRKGRRSWVKRVAERSDAMDLPRGIFKRDAAGIARALKRSAEASTRTKGTKLRPAMSMLNLYANRAGKSLPARDRARLEAAKRALRRLYGRAPDGSRRGLRRR